MSELLAQIRANPRDRELRSVYADALASTDPARGELIAIELANEPALQRRRRELRRQHAMRWWGLPAHAVHTREGFATRVTVRHGDPYPRRLFANELVTEVEVDGTVDEAIFAGLATEPQVSALLLRGQLDDRWAALAKRSFEALTLLRCELVGALELPVCGTLRFVDTILDEQALANLAAWPGLPALHALELGESNHVTAELARVIRGATALRSLRWIRPWFHASFEGHREILQALAAVPEVELIDAQIFGLEAPARFATHPRQAHATIELADHLLVLEHVGGNGWRMIVDGEPRRVRWRFVTVTREYGAETRHGEDDWHDEDGAPLDGVALGARLGRWPSCTPDGVLLWSSGQNRDTWVLLPERGPVEVTFQSYHEGSDD